jgi:predicted dehydrogenase
MVVDFAEKNLLQKARARPDLVKQVLEKAGREGILTSLGAVRNRLQQPMALGYSCAGIVLDVASDVEDYKIGDRVAAAGGGHAMHAEVVAVPRNLVALLPETVDYDAAAFTTVGAIALQGIRLADVKLGETIAVIGLGLLGQLTIQLLRASGCTVIGVDLQQQRATLAQNLGATHTTSKFEEFVQICARETAGHGVDAVLITADTRSNQPVEMAGVIARRKGVVVAVGAVGMNIPRKVYYEKELDFRISTSYGPGRYDPLYEEQGIDYPFAYVRWTENRNMQAFIQQLAIGGVVLAPLISHRFAIEDGASAYDVILGKRKEPFLGVVLTYPETTAPVRRVDLRGKKDAASLVSSRVSTTLDTIRLGVLGAGNYANATLLPVVKGIPEIALVGVSSAKGVTARTAADRFKFAYCTTDNKQILTDPQINTVALLTRHGLHASQVLEALAQGKHVFVEKPLCLTTAELDQIVVAQRLASQTDSASTITVGFNRRFAPFVHELKRHLHSIAEPLAISIRANAGYIPLDHWVHDPKQGGGRLLGEACHFLDLLFFLAGSPASSVYTTVLPDNGKYCQDNFTVTVRFANGSSGTLWYVANGDRSLGKEFIEVFGGGLAARIDDFRTLEIRSAAKNIRRTAWLRQDKGHRAEWQALSAHLQGMTAPPIAFNEIVHSTRISLAAHESLLTNQPIILFGESTS